MAREPEYEFDTRTQREVLLDPEVAHEWVVTLEQQGFIGDPMRVVWLRILERLEEAESLGWLVLERSGGPANTTALAGADLPLTSVTAAIRLAHVLQWRGDFETAHELYDKAIATVESVEMLTEDSAYAEYLRPFAYQHLARCHYDQGDYEAAIDTCEMALELRRAAGAPLEHVLSSEGLLFAAQTRLDQILGS